MPHTLYFTELTLRKKCKALNRSDKIMQEFCWEVLRTYVYQFDIVEGEIKNDHYHVTIEM